MSRELVRNSAEALKGIPNEAVEKYWSFLREVNFAELVPGIDYRLETENHCDIFWANASFLSARSPKVKWLCELIECGQSPSSIAERALERLPFQSFEILEIGGPFAQFLHAFGAEVWCIDPDIEGRNVWAVANYKYSPVSRMELYHPIPQWLTAENWRDFFVNGQFDVTFSRHILTGQSGVLSEYPWPQNDFSILKQNMKGSPESEIRRKRFEISRKEAQRRKDIFAIAAEVTKSGGLVIHEGASLAEIVNESCFINSLNLELLLAGVPFNTVRDRFGSEKHDRIYVYRKT